MRAISYSPPAPKFGLAARPFALRMPNLTLPVVGLALLAVLIAAQAIHGFTDPDYWWHYKTGEYIATHYALPRVDIFSFPSAGQPWMTHEWLAETLIYTVVRTGGYGLALVLFTLSPLLATFLLFRLQRQEAVPARVALPVTALSALMIAPFTTVRPQVLSWALFAVLVYVLYSYHAGRIRHLWALPPLFAVWANLHLSFVFGLGIVALFVATTAAGKCLGTRSVPLRWPLLALAASVGAACLNPSGASLLLIPLRYLPLQGAFTAPMGLAEWQAPDFHNYLFVPLMAGLLLLMATGVVGRRLDLWCAGLALATAALALLAVRYIPIFAIAFAPVAGVALTDRWQWAQAHSAGEDSTRRSLLHWGLLLLVIACLGIALRPGAASQLRRQASADPAFLPVEAVSYVQQALPAARLFNQYEWGGYLTYRLWPQNRPFIDGREEMYDLRFLKEYVQVYAVLPGWKLVLDRYDVDTVIVRGNSSLAGALDASPEWQTTYKDGVAVVYTRN